MDNLPQRMHEEIFATKVFGEQLLKENPAPLLRLHAKRAAAPLGLRSFDQHKVQETLRGARGGKRTIVCACKSCRVLFATAAMDANRHRLLLGAAPRKARTGLASNFVN